VAVVFLRLTGVNRFLVIVITIIFVVDSILLRMDNQVLHQILALSASSFFNGLFFQLFTYPFLSEGLMNLIFNGLLLWFIGMEIENLWGKKKYILFLTVATMISGLIFILISTIFGVGALPLYGISSLTNALLVVYALLYPNRQLLFMLTIPMPAKYFCLVLLGIQLYLGFFSPAASLAWGTVGGMLFAFLFLRFKLSKILKKKAHLKIIYRNGPPYIH
jgi:membrane associated rhomboid family serine protease